MLNTINHFLKVSDESEVGQLKRDTDKVDNFNRKNIKRSRVIDNRYKAKAADTTGEKAEKKYKRKLDYRCAG